MAFSASYLSSFPDLDALLCGRDGGFATGMNIIGGAVITGGLYSAFFLRFSFLHSKSSQSTYIVCVFDRLTSFLASSGSLNPLNSPYAFTVRLSHNSLVVGLARL